MKRRLLIVLCPLVLAACQAPNPYQASSLPLPPAPVQPVESPVDNTVYPSASRDFSHYMSWSWVNDQLPIGSTWASTNEIGDTISAGLDQRGLRPAMNGSAPDLRIAADVHLETRLRQVQSDAYNSVDYYGGGPYHHAYYGGTTVVTPVVRTYEEQVVVVHLDLFDAHTGQPVWSTSAEAPSGGDQTKRSASLRGAVQKALSNYPPG